MVKNKRGSDRVSSIVLSYLVKTTGIVRQLLSMMSALRTVSLILIHSFTLESSGGLFCGRRMLTAPAASSSLKAWGLLSPFLLFAVETLPMFKVNYRGQPVLPFLTGFHKGIAVIEVFQFQIGEKFSFRCLPSGEDGFCHSITA